MDADLQFLVNVENALGCVEVSLAHLRSLYPCDQKNEWVTVPPMEIQKAIHELQAAKAFLLRP